MSTRPSCRGRGPATTRDACPCDTGSPEPRTRTPAHRPAHSGSPRGRGRRPRSAGRSTGSPQATWSTAPHHEHGRVSDKVVQIVEPATGIIGRPLVQLGLDPQYPRLGPLRLRPRHAGIHRRSPAIPVPALRTRCRPSPCDRLSRLGLLRRLRHVPACPAEREPARPRPGRPGGGTSPGRFPRSPRTGRRGRCPALPLRHRHEYAAALPRGLPAGDFTRPRSRPAIPKRQPGVHRHSAHIRQVGADVPLERLYTLVPHVHLPVSLGRPRSSGSADPSRRCQGCSHPPRRLPAQAAPSFTGPLRQTGDGVLPPPSGNAAPRGARSPRSKP